MKHSDHIEAVESRAFAARITMKDLCARAGVLPQTWSRAKRRERISLKVLLKVEAALEAVERGRAA